MQHHIIYAGGRWTTRDLIPRLVVIIEVDQETGLARVLDERTRESWLEEIARIERFWTRRSTLRRLRAVAA